MNRVNLDAMIPRADFGMQGDDYLLDLFQNFPITNLDQTSPILSILRKPDFQRETNHWSPSQIVTFVASFLDNELIPSLILWKSPTNIFVIDGGHRLSALRAWMEDDYGDGPISQRFYNGEISQAQKKIAKKIRSEIERSIGRFSTLKSMMQSGATLGTEVQGRRARALFTRALNLQWVQGTASVAETSFFKINSQGTPLDATEELLLRNRRKPFAIAARAIVRAGYGNKYWSAFSLENQNRIEESAKELFEALFEPETTEPVRTLDLPLAGSSSPVEALATLIEFLYFCNQNQKLSPEDFGSTQVTPGAAVSLDAFKGIRFYADDVTGEATVAALKRGLGVARRMTGNTHGSLGLHPAVFFYNERGKHSRFLFLAMTSLIAQKLASNDGIFFRKFTSARKDLELFLVEHKAMISLLLANINKAERVTRMRQILEFLIQRYARQEPTTLEQAFDHIGTQGRLFEIKSTTGPTVFSDDTKSAMYLRQALASALKCPVCEGMLDPTKSISYDHVVPIREGGLGTLTNGQLAHPYCNQSVKQ